MKYPDIAKRFKDIRIDNRLTQAEFAKVVGLSTPAIGAIENGLYSPSYSVIRALKRRLNISYNFIIDGEHTVDFEKEIKALRDENARLKRVVDKLTKA